MAVVFNHDQGSTQDDTGHDQKRVCKGTNQADGEDMLPLETHPQNVGILRADRDDQTQAEQKAAGNGSRNSVQGSQPFSLSIPIRIASLVPANEKRM